MAQGRTLSMDSMQQLREELFNVMSDGVLIVDEGGVILDCNPAFHNRLGYDKDEIVGQSVASLDPPDFADKVPERIKRIREDGYATFETAHIAKDGSVIPVELNARQFEAEGRTLIFSIVRDITERKHLEDEFSRRFEIYEAAINTPALGFWVVSPQGRFIEVDDTYVQMSGYSHEELLRMSIPDVEAMEKPEETAAHIQQIILEGFARFRTAHRRKDGTVWPCEVVTSFSEIQGGLFIAFIEDLTDRIAQETRLEQASRVYDVMDQAVVVTDRDNKIVSINPATTCITGYTFDELEGRDPKFFASGRHDDAFFERMWDSLNADDHWEGEIWDKRKNGAEYVKNLSINVIRDERGEVMQYVSVFSDITPRKEAEAALRKAHAELDERVKERTRDLLAEIENHKETVHQLRQAKEDAEAASMAKSLFLANMSHELRTPLNAIIGFSDLMVQETLGPVGNSNYLGYLNDINSSGSHLLAVINDILDVSKVETGKMTIEPEEVACEDVVERLRPLIHAKAEGSDVRLVFDIAENLPFVVADARRLVQVLLNLLSNAVKFSEPGDAVTLSVSRCPTNAWVEFVVTDEGIGMTPRESARAQRPFEQIDGRMERRYGGTGLGLYLARSFTELMGGEFALQSEKRKGTTARVSIPVA